MPTIIHTLKRSREDYDLLYLAHRGRYLHGQCYEFATALHQGLGWPMVGLIKPYDEPSKKHNLIWHVGVRTPDGLIHDVRGFVTEDEFVAEYGLGSSATLREVTLEELRATREVDDYGIGYARRMAETFWPELPWIETEAMRVKAYVDELEAVSRKYGYWLSSNAHVDASRIYPAGDDEGGYELEPNITGHGYTIRRYLNLELKMREAADALRSDDSESD